MARKYVKKVRLEEYDLPVIFACQLKAVSIATTYFEMVDVYRASCVVFKRTLPLFIIVTAIRERQTYLDGLRKQDDEPGFVVPE